MKKHDKELEADEELMRKYFAGYGLTLDDIHNGTHKELDKKLGIKYSFKND